MVARLARAVTEVRASGDATAFEIQSLETFRAAARWTAGAGAAVAAVLLTGLELGDLVGVDEPFRAGVGTAALALSVAAFTLVLVRASAVLTSPTVTLIELVERENVARLKAVRAEKANVSAVADPSKFDKLLAAIATHRGRLLRSEARSPHDLHVMLQKATGDDVAVLEEDVERLTSFATSWSTGEEYRRMTRSLIAGVVVVVSSIMAFSWAVTPVDDRAHPSVRRPFAVRLLLDASRSERKALGLGSECRREAIGAVAVAGELATPEVVTLPSGRCRASRFVVTSSVGVAVPLVGYPANAPRRAAFEARRSRSGGSRSAPSH